MTLETRKRGNAPPPLGTRLGEWVEWASIRLQHAGVRCESGHQTPEAEAAYLVCFALGWPEEEVEARWDEAVPAARWEAARKLVERRIRERKPAAYLTHEAWFAGHRFYVDERVLIPRSRIEILIDDPVWLRKLLGGRDPERVLDLCTGSGCIAIALALAWPVCRVTGVDLSPEALEVAEKNRRLLGVADRVRLARSDLFSGLAGERFDLILTNPPYVPNATCDALPREYLHEPDLALRGGPLGLDLVEPLLRQAPDFLTPDGVVILEVGDEVEAVMRRLWPGLRGRWLRFDFGLSGVLTVGRKALERWRRGAPPSGGFPA
ncbi:MAG: 50S ribosomal protein L3 N(5)-glutamine methyltransferase [Magnetococcales bacterium]|nr:50S ribosomal protein L3 N(5)-glutamine methyltransferase [Magnetococcales bacterium]